MLRSGSVTVLAAAALISLSAATSPPCFARDKSIFSLADPRGDDHGDGTLEYPVAATFLEPGDLDLVRFAAYPAKGGTMFEATFAKPIKVARRQTIDNVGTSLGSIARFGIYNLNVDVYVDTDRVPGSGQRFALPGRKAGIAADSAWERAVVLTPRPYEARSQLRRILTKHAKEELRDTQARVDPEDVDRTKRAIASDVASLVYFPTDIRIAGRTVKFFVPADFLGGEARSDWSYVVAVTGCDLYSSLDIAGKIGLGPDEDRLLVLPVGPGRSSERLGSERDYTSMLPPIMDLVVPAGSSQEEILRNYDQRVGRMVQLPGVVPGAAP